MFQKLLLAAFLSLSPLPADIVYHLTDGLATLQYTAPDFIASQITVQPVDLDSCSDPYVVGATCVSVIFAPDVIGLGHEAEIAWTINIPGIGNEVAGYDYAAGTFGALGHYVDTIGGGFLDITEAAPVPEPQYLWLLAPALTLLYARRRQTL